MALDSLEEALRLQTLNKPVAKNVIFLICDGMSLPTTTTAARILKGQLTGVRVYSQSMYKVSGRTISQLPCPHLLTVCKVRQDEKSWKILSA